MAQNAYFRDGNEIKKLHLPPAKPKEEDVKTIAEEVLEEHKSEFVTPDNVKTINGQSIIGSGDIEIQGGGSSKLEYVKPLTEEWFIADNSPYILDARNELETYWSDDYATRCGGATAYMYSKYDALAESGYCIKKQLTTVTSNGTTFPINAYEFSYANWWIGGQENYYVNRITDNADRFYNKPKIMFTSGVHGNERFTPVALFEFMKRVCTDKEYVKIRSAFDFYVIPIVNPTGIDADIRRNYQNIDINRDADNVATEEMRAIQTYVRELTNNGESKLLWYGDWHQAPTNDDVMSCFMSMQNGDVDEFFFSRFVANGQEALKEVREYIGATDTTSQRVYSWKGSTLATIRNWVANYAEYATCWECSHYERVYTKSGVRNNPIASLMHNSLVDISIRSIADADLVGIKYFGTDTPQTISLVGITATKVKTQYEPNETLNVDDIEVTATYSDGTTTNPTDFTTNVNEIDMSTEGVKSLVITYTDVITKTTSVIINVQSGGSSSLPVYATIDNVTLSSTGKLSAGTSGTKQTTVYEVEPSTTYTITCNAQDNDKACIVCDYDSYYTTVGKSLNNAKSKSLVSSYTFDFTTSDDANFMYLYNTYAGDKTTGLGFTVVKNES